VDVLKIGEYEGGVSSSAIRDFSIEVIEAESNLLAPALHLE
jgi:hypothetical protein